MPSDVIDREAGEVIAWIRAILSHSNLTPSALATSADLQQSTMSRLIRGETTKPTVAVLAKLAAFSPIAVPASVQKRLDQSPQKRREQDMNTWAGTTDNNIPVWGVHPIERDGEFRLNAIPVNFLNRPRALTNSLKLAAFYAPDETMEPRWMAGEPVLFDLAKPARHGDFALIKMTHASDPNADDTYIFRRLVKRSDGKLFLSALGRDKMDAVDLDRILEVRHVLDWNDLVG